MHGIAAVSAMFLRGHVCFFACIPHQFKHNYISAVVEINSKVHHEDVMGHEACYKLILSDDMDRGLSIGVWQPL